MFTRLRTIGVLTAALLAANAHADIMHWFWEVEVNGQAVDATVPVVVGAGDQVDIELWAEFAPYRAGFAGSIFAISATTSFFTTGTVNISELDGYGRNPLLAELTNANGAILDTDGDGLVDAIDDIEVLQLPMFWEDNGDWRDPLPIYSIGWDVSTSPLDRIALIRGETMNGIQTNLVYSDIYGNSRAYDAVNAELVFVPAPMSAAAIAIAVTMYSRTRRSPVHRRRVIR